MQDILAVTGPIYLTIAAGFAAARVGWFSQDDLRVFGRFVLNLALPCLLFEAVSRQPLEDLFNPGYLIGYAGGSLAALGIGYAWARRVSHQGPQAATYMAMGMCCSNSGYVGFPILLLTLPHVAGSALALNMVVENFLMIPLLLALAERDGTGSAARWHEVVAQSIKRLAVNPLVIGLAIGLVFAVFEWRLPAPAARTVTLFAQASSVLSLFLIGGTLSAVSISGMAPRVLPVVVGKLLLHPLLVGLALWAALAAGAALQTDLRNAAVLMAGMPMIGIYPLLALRHGHQKPAAAALLGATLASFFTLNAMLWALRHGGF